MCLSRSVLCLQVVGMHHNDSDHTQLSKAISIFMNNNVVELQVLEVIIMWGSTVQLDLVT